MHESVLSLRMLQHSWGQVSKADTAVFLVETTINMRLECSFRFGMPLASPYEEITCIGCHNN